VKKIIFAWWLERLRSIRLLLKTWFNKKVFLCI